MPHPQLGILFYHPKIMTLQYLLFENRVVPRSSCIPRCSIVLLGE